jgi:putative transcriptional regulator
MNGTSQSLAGHLLIAMPNLADPNFWQSVVLLGVHSDDEGAFGLVINRTLDIDLHEILEELGEEAVPGQLPEVFGGGPVQPSHGFVLYERGQHLVPDDEIAVSDSIVVSGSTETLARLTRAAGDTRYFSWNGRSRRIPGWSPRSTRRSSLTSRPKSAGPQH